ncbi:Crp/Fnr family transcriptional regulator [Geitlerinema sp. PCC 7407]|uniref:Crp/Fnr family transcriptional regulator n=1 Tax=Geitlerinema sp. PCC 7407 TaxID=1173025 RepID=UPI00029F820D|nr:Crp/Fnr family transcriptional regulator [Geitlerinema sp. PCC 7407]AFY65031.1 putative transcriptional regulator, Crp/Fnr family [Geitlerinema sp. PCC 7407]
MFATIEQLQSVQIFAALEETELEALQAQTKLWRYEAGDRVMQEGDRLPSCLYAIAEGTVQITKLATTGKETILRLLGAGEIFAAPALFGDGIAPATVLALTDCSVLTVSREALLAVIQQKPEVALRMMTVFNQRLQQLHETVHGLVSERAIVRLARLLHYAALEEGAQLQANGGFLGDRRPYYQIARSIGITYEECVRLIKRLQAVVRYQRGGKIQILDLAVLEAIARGDLEP